MLDYQLVRRADAPSPIGASASSDGAIVSAGCDVDLPQNDQCTARLIQLQYRTIHHLLQPDYDDTLDVRVYLVGDHMAIVILGFDATPTAHV
eukprot:COSAG01_NODE_11279_length_1966_cov_18.378147_2_plen_92_part_00